MRSKASAIILGAGGLGLLGQGNQFLLVLTSIGSFGMVNSMMQQISHYREIDDLDKEREVKGTVFISQCVCLLIMVTCLLFAIDQVGFFLFDDTNKDYHLAFSLIVIAGPLNVLASNYLEGFFTAYHRFDLYVKASSIVTILGLICFIPSIYVWGVAGGLANIALAEVLLFILFLYYVLKIEKIREIFIFRFSLPMFKGLFTDGMINLICGSLVIILSLVIRQMIISQKGEFDNGIYQFSTSITAYYTPFLTNMLWARYFPTISAKGLTEETKALLSNTILFIVLATSFVLGGILIFPELMIRVLASKEFIVAQKYLAIQFVGDFWYFIFFTFSVLLLAIRSTKKYLVLWLLFLSLQYVGVRLLIHFKDLEGVMIAYTLSCIVMGLMSLFSFLKILGRTKSVFKIYFSILLSFLFVVAEAALVYTDSNVIFRIMLMVGWLLLVVWPHRKAF